MKAATLIGEREFEVGDVNEPELAPGGVIVHIKSVGVCGTDLHEYNAGRGPARMGHEYSGEVVEVGADVTDIRVGDRLAGRGGPAFSEYMSVALGLHDVVTSGAVLVPDGMSYEAACMIEPVSCGVNAAERASPEPGDVVVVIGAGMIGQATWQAFRAMGVAKIIVSEIGSKRLEVARSLGPDIVVKADEDDLTKLVNEETSGRGADIVADCVGSAMTFQQAIEVARGGGFWRGIRPGRSSADDLAGQGGKIVLVGLGGNVDFPMDTMILKGITIVGSICGPLAPARDLMADNRIETEPLITHELPLGDINDAFHLAANPNVAVKVLIKI